MRARHAMGIGACVLGAVLGVQVAQGAAVGVSATRLVLLDKLALGGATKTVLLIQDTAVSKGSATGTDQVSAEIDIRYGSSLGAFIAPAGTYDGSAGWLTNDARLAKYANSLAPAGSTAVVVALAKPGKMLKMRAVGLGDPPLPLRDGAPSPPIFVAFTVNNGGQPYSHCSQFSTCRFRSLAGGAGAKLVCRGGQPDASCAALPTTTTTTTSTTTTLPDLAGAWALFGSPSGSNCNANVASLPFQLGLGISQSGNVLTASGGFVGSVTPTTFTLAQTGPPLGLPCTSGMDFYDAWLTISGTLPSGAGDIAVVQVWSLAPLTFACPPCTSTWNGIMQRIP